jgi:hypothetical protein
MNVFSFTCVFCLMPIFEDQSKPEVNAALQYWQAFALMPETKVLTQEEKRMLSDWQKAELDSRCQGFLKKYRNAFEFLQYGGRFEYCNWGLGPSFRDLGIGAPIPHLPKAFELSKAALLQARYLFAHEQRSEAMKLTISTMSLARHVGLNGTLQSKNLEYLIERNAIDLACMHLTSVGKKNALKEFRQDFAALPVSQSISNSIKQEKEMHLSFFRAKGVKALESLIEDIQTADANKKSEIRAVLGLADENVPKFCIGIEQMFDEVARMALLSPPECAKAEDAYRQKLKKELNSDELPGVNVIGRLILPHASEYRLSEAVMMTQRQMFLAALTILTEGPQHVKDFRDPFGDGPFDYKEREGGFELMGKLKNKDSVRVSLVICGQDKKGQEK